MAHSHVYSWRPDWRLYPLTRLLWKEARENGDLKFNASSEEEDHTTINRGAEITLFIDYKDSERLRHTDWVMKMNRNDKIAAIRIRNRKLLDKMSFVRRATRSRGGKNHTIIKILVTKIFQTDGEQLISLYTSNNGFSGVRWQNFTVHYYKQFTTPSMCYM